MNLKAVELINKSKRRFFNKNNKRIEIAGPMPNSIKAKKWEI